MLRNANEDLIESENHELIVLSDLEKIESLFEERSYYEKEDDKKEKNEFEQFYENYEDKDFDNYYEQIIELANKSKKEEKDIKLLSISNKKKNIMKMRKKKLYRNFLDMQVNEQIPIKLSKENYYQNNMDNSNNSFHNSNLYETIPQYSNKNRFVEVNPYCVKNYDLGKSNLDNNPILNLLRLIKRLNFIIFIIFQVISIFYFICNYINIIKSFTRNSRH